MPFPDGAAARFSAELVGGLALFIVAGHGFLLMTSHPKRIPCWALEDPVPAAIIALARSLTVHRFPKGVTFHFRTISS